MHEFFMYGTTFPAPFVGDKITRYQVASSPADACAQVVSANRHGVGIYMVEAYESADDFHKRLKPAARWESHQCQIDKLSREDARGGCIV